MVSVQVIVVVVIAIESVLTLRHCEGDCVLLLAEVRTSALSGTTII